MTFQEYIISTRVTDTPRGDFIADTKTLINCRKLPTITTWSELYFFVRVTRGGCAEAISQARKVWRQYQKADIKELM